MILMITLCLMIALGGVAYMRSYRIAYTALHNDSTAKEPWHAQPVHYGWWALGRTIGLSLAIWCVWMVLRAPLIETYLMQTLSAEEATNNAFFLSNVRAIAMEGAAIPRNASASLRAWSAQYASLLTTGNVAVAILLLLLALRGCITSIRRVRPSLYARSIIERWVMRAIKVTAALSVLITALIFCSVALESFLFFSRISLDEFLFGLQWSPQTALRADQAGASGLFGMVPLLAGTLLITAIALAVAVPLGLLSAIYIAEYSHNRMRAFAKPMLEVLAGIPTVVYGFFAITVIAPALRDIGLALDMDVASESALAAGLVMGLMIIPLVSSLSDDAIKAVPQSLRDASYGMGATQSETIKKVVLPAALPGIIGGVLLATSRAIGETMIVVMAAGLAANLTANPLESVTTITVQIVSLLVGDQEFGSTKTLAAFALGLTLFIFTLGLNVLALLTVKKYRQAYE